MPHRKMKPYREDGNTKTGYLIMIACICICAYFMSKIYKNEISQIDKNKKQEQSNTMSESQYMKAVEIWKEQEQNNETITDNTKQEYQENQDTIREQETGQEATYKYTDQNGIIGITDNIKKVPEKYRNNTEISYSKKEYPITEVRIANNQIWVPVKMSYRGRNTTALLLLDTGATNISISPAIAQKLGIHPNETNARTATLANGIKVKTAHVTIDSVKVGPKETNGIDVQIMPRDGNEETGLLGMNFLRAHPYMIDTTNSVIRWQ